MNNRQPRRQYFAAVLGLCCLLALAAISAVRLEAKRKIKGKNQKLDAKGAPMFKVEAFWPKPLPNRWSMQQVTGLSVEDKTGHVWFLNRGGAADGDEIGGDGNPP